MEQAGTGTRKSPTSSPSLTDGPQSVIERIRKPSGELSHLAIVIYGRGGAGKTTLLGTMPGKGLVIDVPQVEGGTSVLADKSEKIDVAPVLKWEDLDDFYRHLRSGEHDYKWVALDTISACQELAKRKTIKERDLASDPHQVTMQDWGKIGQLMSELIYQYRLLRNLHVIALAQEKRRESDDGTVELVPNVSPMTLDALLPPQTLVGRLFVAQADDENGVPRWERRLRVGTHERFTTKVRNVKGRELPAVIREPHLGHILGYMLGSDRAKKPVAAEDEAALFEINTDE